MECSPLAKKMNYSRELFSHAGLILAFIASALFSVSFIVAKLVAVHQLQVVLIRMTFLLSGVIPLMIYQNVAFRGFKDLPYIWLTVSSLAGSCLVVCSFIAISLIPAGNAVAIFSIHPISTAFLSWCCLLESVTYIDVVLGLVSIVGVVAITTPEFIFGHVKSTGNKLIGTCFALTAALFTSLLYVGIRKLENKINTLTIIFYTSMCGILITFTLLYFMGAFSLPVLPSEWIYVGVVVFFGVFGQVCMIIALQREKAVYVAIIRTMDIVFSYILEYLWLGSQPDLTGIGGAVLVMMSTMGVTIQKLYVGRT